MSSKCLAELPLLIGDKKVDKNEAKDIEKLEVDQKCLRLFRKNCLWVAFVSKLFKKFAVVHRFRFMVAHYFLFDQKRCMQVGCSCLYTKATESETIELISEHSNTAHHHYQSLLNTPPAGKARKKE